MARRKPLTNTTLEPKPPINPNAAEDMKAARLIRYTAEQTRQHKAFVEEMLTQGYALSTIKVQMRARFQVPQGRAVKMVERVHQEWQQDAARQSKGKREAQIRRIMRKIRELQGERDPDDQTKWKVAPRYNELAKFENLYADIAGTREPVHTVVDMKVEMTETLAAVVVNLDPEQMEEYLASARRRQALIAASGDETLRAPMGIPALMGGKNEG